MRIQQCAFEIELMIKLNTKMSTMSCNSSDSINELEQLQLIAREHIEHKGHNEACLPEWIVEKISKDTAFKSLFGQLPSFNDQRDIQVGAVMHDFRSF
jgi:hypothetical protein